MIGVGWSKRTLANAHNNNILRTRASDKGTTNDASDIGWEDLLQKKRV